VSEYFRFLLCGAQKEEEDARLEALLLKAQARGTAAKHRLRKKRP